MAAIVLKPNRPMLRGILTGAVSLDYATHRHPLWIAEIEGASAAKAEPPEPPTEVAAGTKEAPAPPSDAEGKREEPPIITEGPLTPAEEDAPEQKA